MGGGRQSHDGGQVRQAEVTGECRYEGKMYIQVLKANVSQTQFDRKEVLRYPLQRIVTDFRKNGVRAAARETEVSQAYPSGRPL